MTRMPPLETRRLFIRPFRLADLHRVHHLLDVELAAVEFGSEGAGTLQQRRAWLRWSVLNEAQLARLYQPPYGDRAVVLKNTDEIIGACGFVPSFGPFGQLATLAVDAPAARLYTPELGLFYAVSPAFQRHGYAVEAVGAIVGYAFEHLQLRRIVATTTYDNAASIRVMEKVGMRIDRNPYPEPPWFQVIGVLENPAAQ